MRATNEKKAIEQSPPADNTDLACIYWLNKDTVFFEKDNLLFLEKDGDSERIFLRRAFPFLHHNTYISVQDSEKKELGMIRNIADFPEDIAILLKRELERMYYCPRLLSIFSIKENFGYSHWKVTTETGDMTFTLQDTFRSIFRFGEDTVIITDIDGNRFQIQSLAELDPKSYKKIELYL